MSAEITWTADPEGLESRLDRLMDALVSAGAPDPAIGVTLSIGLITLTLGEDLRAAPVGGPGPNGDGGS